MGLSSLHVCMDSSDHWLQDEGGIMESCSSPISGGEMVMTCTTRPSSSSMIGGGGERRLRPPHDQSLKCPRCDSTHTKFCYYNNYSLSQPRYFCKTCRRYWTKGGTLRNIPVGGGCRKNKKVSSKKSNTNNNNDPLLPPNTSSNSQQNHHLQLHHTAGPSSYIINHHHHKDLQLSFPDVQFNSHLSNILGNNNNSNFMESKYGGIGANINGMLENPVIRPIDFIMESKLEGIIGNSSRNFDFFGNGEMGMANVGLGGDHMTMNNHHGHHHHHHHGTNFHGLNSTPPPPPHHSASFGGMSLDGGSNNGVNFMMDSSSSSSSCQRLMLPYDAGTSEDHNNNNAPIDVKPNPKLLSLEWQQEQGCSDAGKDSFGYGSWSAMMNGYGSSATNPLI